MPHDDAVYLHHILDAIVQIEEYVLKSQIQAILAGLADDKD